MASPGELSLLRLFGGAARAMLAACRAGDLEAAQVCLLADPAALEETFGDAFEKACASGCLALVQWLWPRRLSARPCSQGDEDIRAGLQEACKLRNPSVLGWLLCVAPAEAIAAQGPLLFEIATAGYGSHPAVVALWPELAARGCLPSAVELASCFVRACAGPEAELVRWIWERLRGMPGLPAGCVVDAFCSAVANGQLEVAEFLWGIREEGVGPIDVNMEDDSLFELASDSGNQALVSFLLSKSPPDYSADTRGGYVHGQCLLEAKRAEAP